MNYVNPKKAASFYGVTNQTLRRWAQAGQIDYIISDGGHRRYAIIKKNVNRSKIIYARVSSHKQKDDLQRQIKFLKKYHPNYQIIKDIGSGINFQRKGFQTMLDRLFNGSLEEVVVTHKDRFARFAFELLENIFKRFGSKITILCTEKEQNPNEELTKDLLSIITVFSSRYYGKRKYIL